MQNSEINNNIRTFLVDNFLSGRGASLHEDDQLLGNVIDSTGVMELVMFLQEHFRIAIADDEVNAENLGSLRNSTRFVEAKLHSPR